VLGIQKSYQDKRSATNRAKSDDSGFSLIEVLIASTVFSLGLAGFTALLLSSIMGSAEARREGIASIAAANLSEQIRLNPLALARYLNPPKNISRICTTDNNCTPEQQADYDFRLWQLELADSIRNARGLVCRDETPEDGIEGNSQCNGAGPLVIKIFWDGQSSGRINGLSNGLSGENANNSTIHRLIFPIS
jgi:type IV pilus modification protein PilV